jgi:phosphoribosylaminoimidazole-succinocarboxamide synthase
MNKSHEANLTNPAVHKLKITNMLTDAIISTNFTLPQQIDVYKGKVRDVYNIDNQYLVMIVTDRISAFDVVLPRGIPYKGQVLNQIASKFLDATADIVPNWKIASPDPMVTVGLRAEPLPVEMVIRGYLTGHAWREYRSGKRTLCGISLPEGLKENQRFERPIITPTTKAQIGHDEDISREEIISSGLVTEEIYAQVEEYTYRLFQRGTEMANEMGLILVDTKYEFGISNGRIILIDEIHTPDSSRYFYAGTYQENFDKGLEQKQLSKEFVRQWLIDNHFQGKEGQTVPEMTDDFVEQVSERYIELYEKITGEPFQREGGKNVQNRIQNNIHDFMKSL